MTSRNVKTLFTLVPVDPSIQIVKQKLLQGPTLPQRTNISIQHIITLLEFCLKTHTSSSKVSIMNRSKVQPWVPPSALSLPTYLWKSLKSKSLALPHTPHLWLRFVDDMYVIQQAEHSQQLLHHINTQDSHIQFTIEEPNQDGSLPFLETQVSPHPNNTLITTVYRKPTHTDQYLHWDSNHFIGAKYSVFNTLAHRAKVVSYNQQSLHKELDHIRKDLHACHFQTWTLNKLQQKFESKHHTNKFHAHST